MDSWLYPTAGSPASGVPAGAGSPSAGGTFAQMKAVAAPTDGQLYYVSNYGKGGSLWRYSTTALDWFPTAPTKIYENTALITGLQQTAVQLLVAIPCEANLLANKVFRLIASLGKDGVTDAYGTATDLRSGTTGTVADAVIHTTNLSGTLSAAQRSAGIESWLRAASATSLQKLGGNNVGAFNASGSAAILNNPATVADITTQLTYLSITTTMGGVTNKPQVGYVALEIQP